MLLALLVACHADCGDYSVSTGVWADHVMGDLWDGDPTGNPEFDPAYHDVWPLDGEYYEMCGKRWGTFGSWNPLGDGRSTVFFRLDDRDPDRDVNGLFLDVWVSFPTSAAVAGSTVTLESGQLLGEAAVVDGGGERFHISPLAAGTLDVTSGEIAGDVCAEDEGWGGGGGPSFGLAWSFVFENVAEETRFTTDGADEVWFDTTSSADCAPY